MVGERFSRSLQERRPFAGVRWTAREIFGSRTARPKVKLGAGAPSEICSLCEHVKLSAAPIVTRAARISPCGSSLTLAAIYSRGTYRPTTIDAPMFHFRVRNGTGWGHWAMTTRFQMLFCGGFCLSGCHLPWVGGCVLCAGFALRVLRGKQADIRVAMCVGFQVLRFF